MFVHEILIKIRAIRIDSNGSGRCPYVVVIDLKQLQNEFLKFG